mgnify:CR=1 FL=1
MKSFGYYVIKAFTKPLSLLPLGFHRGCGRFLGWFMRSVLHYRRDVVMINLARSFPDRKYGELREICRKTYRHIATLFCETVWFGSASPGRLKKSRIVEIDNPEVLNGFYAKKKSVFVLTSHRGNWELVGGLKSYGGLDFPENDFSVVYRELSSKAWDEFMYANRITPIADKEHFDGIVESFQIMRYAFNNRNGTKCYYFITDQYPYTETSKVKVNDFMHQTTFSMNGGAALAKMFGMAVVYLDMSLTEEGNYRMHFTTIADDASKMEMTDMLNRYYSLLQADLEREPWNYLWTHKRWK